MSLTVTALEIVIVLGTLGFLYGYVFKGMIKLPARKSITYEERTVPASEAAELLKDKRNKQTKINADGTITLRVAKIVVAAPPSMTNTPVPKEVKIGRNVPIEFSRLKEKIEDIDKKDIKRITLVKSKAGRTAVLITRKTGIKGLPYAMHYVDYAQLQSDGKLRFDMMWAEAIDPETGRAEFSEELEGLWVDGIMTQILDVAASFGIFQISKAMAIMMAISFVGFLFIVIGANSVFHFTPTTIVHWLPAVPTFQK